MVGSRANAQPKIAQLHKLYSVHVDISIFTILPRQSYQSYHINHIKHINIDHFAQTIIVDVPAIVGPFDDASSLLSLCLEVFLALLDSIVQQNGDNVVISLAVIVIVSQ